MNRRRKAGLFFIIICIQYIFVGLNVVKAFKPEEPNTIQTINNSISHSSPYYFPTNRSTPLMIEDFGESYSEDSPFFLISLIIVLSFSWSGFFTINLNRSSELHILQFPFASIWITDDSDKTQVLHTGLLGSFMIFCLP